MALKYILDKCAQKMNQGIDATELRTWVIEEINIVAKQMYAMVDKDQDLYEVNFNYELTVNSVTLPSYIGIPRGFRMYYLGQRISQVSCVPKYHNSTWDAADFCKFRIQRTNPLERTIQNTAKLTIQLTKPDTNIVTVVINGSTDNSGKVEEVVTFLPGEVEHETTNQFSPLNPISNIGINSIQKYIYDPSTNKRIHSASVGDALIIDAEGTELARVPNNQTDSSYVLVQLYDFPVSYVWPQTAVDCLFKKKFEPLIFDSDIFANNKYDDVIMWGVLANNAISQTDRDANKALYSEFYTSLNIDWENSQDKSLDLGSSRYVGRCRYADRRNSYAFRLPWRYGYAPWGYQ